ncbi:hypothetical protein Tco_1258339, partial [Tanacetum coccineum]
MQRERAAQEEASNAALIVEFDDIQARMDADALLAARPQEGEREQFSIDEQARFLVETIVERKRFTYNQLKNKNVDKDELRACLDIVPGDDISINVEYLTTKYLIIDWKTHILTENMMYYQIIRADGSSKNYKIFNEMLDDFDRQDVVDLYSLVKERYEIISPEGINNVHDKFHMSNLKKCLADRTLQIPLDEMKVDARLNFVEEPVEILEREFKKIKRSRIAIVK